MIVSNIFRAFAGMVGAAENDRYKNLLDMEKAQARVQRKKKKQAAPSSSRLASQPAPPKPPQKQQQQQQQQQQG